MKWMGAKRFQAEHGTKAGKSKNASPIRREGKAWGFWTSLQEARIRGRGFIPERGLSLLACRSCEAQPFVVCCRFEGRSRGRGIIRAAPQRHRHPRPGAVALAPLAGPMCYQPQASRARGLRVSVAL